MAVTLRSVVDLIIAERAGTLPEPLFFWGHRPPAGGGLGPSCLSQWWPAPFELDGRRFATAEHHMMWHKATLFGDPAAAARVLATTDPAEAKAAGRAVRRFDATAWADRAFDVVVEGNRAKFGQDPALADYLRGTGDRVLVEASPTDTIWGIGLRATDPDAAVPSNWPGTNLLGFALMRVRAELRAHPTTDGAATAS